MRFDFHLLSTQYCWWPRECGGAFGKANSVQTLLMSWSSFASKCFEWNYAVCMRNVLGAFQLLAHKESEHLFLSLRWRWLIRVPGCYKGFLKVEIINDDYWLEAACVYGEVKQFNVLTCQRGYGK